MPGAGNLHTIIGENEEEGVDGWEGVRGHSQRVGPGAVFPGRRAFSGAARSVLRSVWAAGLLGWPLAVSAQVPGLLNFQGRILAGDVVFTGTGHFKFSLVNANGTQIFWGNSGDANFDGVPDEAVRVPVAGGLYSVLLGDTSLPNMGSLPVSAFTGGEVYLRVWFHDGLSPSGFERLAPDQRVVSVGYAMMAATVSDGSVTSTKLANGAVATGALADGAVTTAKLADGAVGGAKLGAGAVGSQHLADGAVTGAKLAAGAVSAGSVSGVLAPGQLPPTVTYQPDLTAASNSLAAQLAALTARVNALSTGGGDAPAGMVLSSARPDDPVLIGSGFSVFTSVPAPSWQDGAADGAPSARIGHAGGWTGSQFLVWGGEVAAGTYSASGAAYDPARDAWSPLTPFGAPVARSGPSGVWTGLEWIVWGGFGSTGYRGDGAAWIPAEASWRDLPLSGAPAARDRHIAAWTTGGMVVWGGRNESGPLDSGALYDPESNAWTPLILPGQPAARMAASGVWTGQGLLVWGGQGASGFLRSGGELMFDDFGGAFQWRDLPTASAPTPRMGHSSVWTGTAMLIWGGVDGSGTLLNDGASYDPASRTWSSLPAVGAPTARRDAASVWTGTEWLILGGTGADGPVAGGAAYDPIQGRWRSLTSNGGPDPRSAGVAVWTGEELAIFGGTGSGGQRLGALERLNPAAAWYLYRAP